MIGLASMFTVKEQQALQKYCGIVLNDDKDYTDDEILEIYELFCETFPHEYDSKGRPMETALLFEHIVDKLVEL